MVISPMGCVPARTRFDSTPDSRLRLRADSRGMGPRLRAWTSDLRGRPQAFDLDTAGDLDRLGEPGSAPVRGSRCLAEGFPEVRPGDD